MAEGRVAQVVGQGNRLGQVLVEPQRPGDGAADGGHFNRVGQPGTEVVARAVEEHLRLVFQAAEGARVDDPRAVALETRCGRRGAAPGGGRPALAALACA